MATRRAVLNDQSQLDLFAASLPRFVGVEALHLPERAAVPDAGSDVSTRRANRGRQESSPEWDEPAPESHSTADEITPPRLVVLPSPIADPETSRNQNNYRISDNEIGRAHV